MRFVETGLAPSRIVEIERREDERGCFARAWCEAEFAAAGIAARWVQMNLSTSRARGTLRGLHYQLAPWQEAKLVRCSRGALHDVILDLRAGSPTAGRWLAVTLRAGDDRWLYVPPGFAHGFQTLADDTEASYLVSAPYHAEAERGIRHDDPAFAIAWPLPVSVISAKDAAWPDWRPVPRP